MFSFLSFYYSALFPIPSVKIVRKSGIICTYVCLYVLQFGWNRNDSLIRIFHNILKIIQKFRTLIKRSFANYLSRIYPIFFTSRWNKRYLKTKKKKVWIFKISQSFKFLKFCKNPNSNSFITSRWNKRYLKTKKKRSMHFLSNFKVSSSKIPP